MRELDERLKRQGRSIWKKSEGQLSMPCYFHCWRLSPFRELPRATLTLFIGILQCWKECQKCERLRRDSYVLLLTKTIAYLSQIAIAAFWHCPSRRRATSLLAKAGTNTRNLTPAVVYLLSLRSLKKGVALWGSRDSYADSSLFFLPLPDSLTYVLLAQAIACEARCSSTTVFGCIRLQTSHILEAIFCVFSTRFHVDCDLEAPLRHPNWFLNHKHMLRANHEEQVNRMPYFILKVPEYYRQPSVEFIPQGWHFGLHNRENLDTIGSEALKLSFAVAYGLVGEKWDDFCNAIVDDPKAMLICYGLQEGETSWSDDYIKHVLALDALFLAVYLDIQFPAHENQLWTPKVVPCIPDPNNVFYSRYKGWENIVRTDLRRIENQIPFFLIQRVVEYFKHSMTVEDDNGCTKYLERSLDYAVHLVTFCFIDTFKMDIPYPLEDRTHILGAVYEVICGSKGLLKSSVSKNEYVHIPSATTLQHAGIRIIGVDGPLDTLSYNKKSLFLPKMRIYDDTISFIRNMAWYEWNTSNKGCMFHDYIFFIDDLIQAPGDLDLLVKRGVIYNGCGIKTFKKWKLLMEGLIEVLSSQEHHDMKVAIKRRCEVKRHRLWSEFRVLFCSRPWLAMSTIAVVLVTLTMLIQAYTAVIASNTMKPQFP